MTMWHNVFMASLPTPAEVPSFLVSLHLDLETVEAGVPVEVMMQFLLASGVELKDTYDIVLPARTLKHRRARKQSLSSDESDKLVRLVRVFDLAVAVFGDAAQARAWLHRAKKRFDGRKPLHMLRTDMGARMVEEMLGQIDDGMFA